MKVVPFNPYPIGGGQMVARTIKAQYQQSSLANFIRHDGLGATGVIAYEEDIQAVPISERSE